MQMVFQSPEATLNPRHRVREVLARSLKMLGGTRTVEELADVCRIEPGHLDRLTSQLSGGQKQRVAIARAIAGDAPLVVCDEPVSALDVSVQASILRLLVELQAQRSTSYLFVSHDLGVVGYLADWIVVMNRGEIVEQGPAEDVFSNPTHPYTQRLLAASERRAPDDIALDLEVLDAVNG
jgi:peptide/nickel transport system ATP-binding protein